MYDEVRVQNFRGLRDFEMRNLGRINLLVGTNNCGKSSILEALELIASRGNIRTILNAVFRRGERLWIEDDTSRYSEGDISHLFHGHELDLRSEITVSADGKSGPESVSLSIAPRENEQPGLFSDQNSLPFEDELNLEVRWVNRETEFKLGTPISSRGGISSRSTFRKAGEFPTSPAIHFISTAALSTEKVLILLDEIVLTPEEDLLVEALKTIEPSIERIASLGGDRIRPPSNIRQGGVVVKTNKFNNRIPIGSMGDGMWRMLGIALSLVNAENGILLVDEIDTGLHYSVLSNMWKLVQRTAERLNIQVFATTHSRDCYESLAEICRDEVSDGSQVTIQRIESGSSCATAFTEQEIIAAADRGVEVR